MFFGFRGVGGGVSAHLLKRAQFREHLTLPLCIPGALWSALAQEASWRPAQGTVPSQSLRLG